MSRRRWKQSSKSKNPEVTDAVFDHPEGEQWAIDQQRSSNRRQKIEGKKVDPTPLIPGVAAPILILPPLPEIGLRDEFRDPISVPSIVRPGEALATPVYQIDDLRKLKGLKSTEVIVEGFPPQLNRLTRTASEAETVRGERRDFVNLNCINIGTDRGGARKGKLQYRPTLGAEEQCFGLLGLDLSLILRAGAHSGLDPMKWIERLMKYGAELLRRHYKVVVYMGFFHPGNPYLADGELGFGGHIQYYTVRAFMGRWLTPERDFRRLGPATCSGLQKVRMGVDVHQSTRKRFEVRQAWLFGSSTVDDWNGLKLKKKTIRRILSVRRMVKAGTSTVEAEVLRDLKAWDATFGRQKKNRKGEDYVGSRSMTEVYERNLRSASEHQLPVDWVLSQRVTIKLIKDLLKDKVWKPLVERAQTCAREIQTEYYRGGFRRSLSDLLLDWEARRAALELKTREKSEAELRKQLLDATRLGNSIVDQNAELVRNLDEVRGAVGKERRKVGLAAQGQINEWLTGLRRVMCGLPPTESMLKQGFFQPHVSGRFQLVGGVESATRVVEFGLREAGAAKEFIRLANLQSQALEKYSQLKSEVSLVAAEGFLAGEEEKWASELKPQMVNDKVAPENPLEAVFRAASDELSRAQKGLVQVPEFLVRDITKIGNYVIKAEIVALAAASTSTAAKNLTTQAALIESRYKLEALHEALTRRNSGVLHPKDAEFIGKDGKMAAKWIGLLKLEDKCLRGPGSKPSASQVTIVQACLREIEESVKKLYSKPVEHEVSNLGPDRETI